MKKPQKKKKPRIKKIGKLKLIHQDTSEGGDEIHVYATIATSPCCATCSCAGTGS